MCKRREPWIDAIKIGAILLVMIGHLPINQEFRRILFAFHVPLFFCVSGMLYTQRPFFVELKKGVKSLIVPYFIIQLICLLYYWGKGLVPVENLIFGMLLGDNYVTENVYPPSFALWYIIALLFLRCGGCFVSKRTVVPIIGGALVFAEICSRQGQMNTLFSLDSAVISIPYFAFGYFIKKNRNLFENKSFVASSIILIVALVIEILYAHDRHFDISNCRIDGVGIVYYAVVLFVCFAVIRFSSHLKFSEKKMKLLENLNSGMILIVGTHYILLINIWGHIFDPGLRTSWVYCVYGVLICLICLICYYYPIKVIKKYFPLILGCR